MTERTKSEGHQISTTQLAHYPRSGILAKHRFALFQESSDPFDEVR
jgi:hypothetical protein